MPIGPRVDGAHRLYGYEEGVGGSRVLVGVNGVTAGTGRLTYTNQAAMHGALGVEVTSAGGAGTLTYAAPGTTEGAGSIYLRTVSRGPKATRVLAFRTGSTVVVEVGLEISGAVNLSSPGDGRLIRGQRKASLTMWTRIDWQTVWEGGNLSVVLHYFPADAESWADYEEISATVVTAAAPDAVSVGSPSSSWRVQLDTLRVYDGAAAWAGPFAPPMLAYKYAQPGTVTQSGATIAVRVVASASLDLGWSTTADENGTPTEAITYAGAQVPDFDGFTKFLIAGLPAGTTHYAKVCTRPGAFLGDPIQFTTHPADSTAIAGLTFAVTGGQQHWANEPVVAGMPLELVWKDLLRWRPEHNFFLGDDGYWGWQNQVGDTIRTLASRYWAEFDGLPNMRRANARVPSDWAMGGHDIAVGSPDSRESATVSTLSKAMQGSFALNPMFDDGTGFKPTNKRGLYGAYLLTSRVRVIMLDAESLDRTRGRTPDSPLKTFLGAPQDAWLRQLLLTDAPAVNIVMCSKDFLGDSIGGVPSTDEQDKICAYPSWRASFGAFVQDNNVPLVWIGSDRRANGYSPGGTTNPWGGFPCYLSSGVSTAALPKPPGDDGYSSSFGWRPPDFPPGVEKTVMQYMQFTLSDDNAGTVTLTGRSRQLDNTFDGTGAESALWESWSLEDGFTGVNAWAYAPSVITSWAGDALQHTVQLSVRTHSFTSVGIAVSSNADQSSRTLYPTAQSESPGWSRAVPDGLIAGTEYSWQATNTLGDGTVQLVGPVSRFRTLQEVGTGCTTRIAIGSCKQTAPSSVAVWDDIANWAPDRFVDLGDFGYPGYLTTDQESHVRNWAWNAQDTGRKTVQAICAVDYLISDHDVNGGETATGNTQNYNDPTTMASLLAWEHTVPARMEDVLVPRHGRWRAEVEGNVRYLKVDTRSIDKTDNTTTSTDPASPQSTMLGATQLAWWKAQIDAAAEAHQLVVMFTDPGWNGTSPGPPIPFTYCDKWPSYIFERDLMSDYAASRIGPNMVIAYGDSHLLQQDDGTNEKNGFATMCCGPIHQNLHAHYQSTSQWNYPADIVEGAGKARNGMQYQRLTIAQAPGSSTVTVTAEARDCTPGVSGTPLTVRTMTRTYTL
jgi:phosphodiesterase/alkaline phosphatase D-like protein